MKDSAANRIGQSRLSPFVWLLIAFFVFISLYTFINGYCKHMETYADEPLYYSVAEGLIKGMGFPTVNGDPFPTKRLVYSLLISPAFLTGNRIIQFRLIALINAIVIGSGIFPVYLLANGVLKDRRYALLAGLLYLIQPDMQFTASFMSENAMLPASLWVIYFTWMLTNKTDLAPVKQALCFGGVASFSIILVYIKQSGFIVVLGSLFWIAMHYSAVFFKGFRQNSHHSRAHIWLPILLTVLAGIVFALFRSDIIGTAFTFFSTSILNMLRSRALLFLYYYLLTWATEILAIGIFPLIVPMMSYKDLSKGSRALFNYLLLLTAAANLVLTRTSVYYSPDSFLLYQRYVIYIWIPYIIVFMDALRQPTKSSPIACLTVCAATALFCVCFHGAQMGSAFDAPLLYWAKGWMDHRKIWCVIVFMFTVVGFALLRYRKSLFVPMFIIIMLSLQAYNHVAMYDLVHRAYTFSYENISEVESFISNNPDKHFIVVVIPTTPGEVHFNSKVSDTYLLHRNSYIVPASMILNNENPDGIDLSKGDVRLTSRADLQGVDYIILTNEMSIDRAQCQDTMSCPYFTVYKLNDPTRLPYISSSLIS